MKKLKLLSLVYSTNKKRGWFRLECLQWHARTKLLHRLSQFIQALLGRTQSRGRCLAAIRLSCHPELSGHAVQGKVGGLDIRGQHGRRFVFLHHTHRPQRKLYPFCASRSPTPVWRRLNRTHAVLGRSVREGGCRCGGWKCWVLNALQPFSILPHLFYCCQMNWWVVVQRVEMGVSIWDALHLHSMDRWALSGAGVRDPWRARDNVAPLQRSSAGWMPATTGRLSAGVGRRHTVTISKVSLMAGLISTSRTVSLRSVCCFFWKAETASQRCS